MKKFFLITILCFVLIRGDSQPNCSNLVIEGHSFVASGTWCAYYIPLETDTCRTYNSGKEGSVISDVAGRASIVDGKLVTETTHRKNILVLWLGVNDMTNNAGDVNKTYDAYKAYVHDRIASGWKVFAYTITPTNGYGRGTDFEQKRVVFNNLLRNDLSELTGVYIIDTDEVSEFDNPSNKTYYSDGLHFTQAGSNLASGLFGKAISTYWKVENSGTTYYVSSTGRDSNSGTSMSSPWKTLSKINNTRFSAGDKIKFHSGDTFRGYLLIQGSGAPGKEITITSYGTGDKPKILGSLDISGSEKWTNHSGNIWKTTIKVSTSEINDIGNIILNKEESCGIRKTEPGNCTSQGNWYFNATDDLVYMYSAYNPGSYYNHIEAGGVYSENILSIVNRNYITIDGLDVRYSANNGIFLRNTSNIKIQNCDVSFIGGMYYGPPYRMGNGIQMWADNSNIIVRYNYIHDIYDAGISPQGSGTLTQRNINMYYNVFKNCYYTYELFCKTNITLKNIRFYNNTCLYAGTTWSVNQRPDSSNARHVRSWEEGANITGLEIKNNIFYSATQTAYAFYYSSAFDIDYNLYHVKSIGFIFDTNYNSLQSWQSALSDDYHSLSGDPLFNPDYSLRGTSPAIDAGVNLGFTRDFAGNKVGSSPDIGAYEYTSKTGEEPARTGKFFKRHKN